MTRLIIPIIAFAAVVPYVNAGISFTSPKAGAKLVAGTAIEVNWEDGGDGPSISDLTTFQLFLCAGGSGANQFTVLRPITTTGSFSSGNAASALIDTGAGEDQPNNAYFIQMIAVGKSGGVLTTYSSRFSYSGMEGAFPVDIQSYLSSISGTDGPATQDATVNPANPAAPNPAAGDFGVAYTMQTGLTRFAPMQPVPPTKITAKNTKPLYPTSSVSIATTRLPIPKIQTTLTQPQTYSVSSRQNTVAPAAQPSDDMQKFLNRWKD